MTSIYELHDKAFARVSAFVIARNGERVATIALKFPADGAGRLYAYVHWIGLEMVRGHAGGYGYDKRTAACEDAIRRMCQKETPASSWDFSRALSDDTGGLDWTRRLENAGFTVWQAC